MDNKKVLIIALILTIMLMSGCILNMPIIILGSVGAICCCIGALNLNEAALLLFYFSPMSYILVYNQFNLYILLVVSYIIVFLVKRKNAIGLLLGFFILGYCFVFADFEMPMNIGQFIYPLLLCSLFFTCQIINRQDYKKVINFFLIGFIVSAVIGFFKEQIPMMWEIFGVDELYIEGVETSMDIIRYSGLSFDPNFFALTDCILISILLLCEKKIDFRKGLSVIFLIVIGLFTYSKSYIIMLAVILLAYIFMKSKNPFKNISIVVLVFAFLLVLERAFDLNVLSLIEARFTTVEGAEALTTGRVHLWKEYVEYIVNNGWCLLFGEGFNTLSLSKAAHNTYIDFVYRFGTIGTLLWITFFVLCKKVVDKTGIERTSKNITLLILLFGIFFLSAFHFQQLWCCIFLAFISPYSDGGTYEKNKCDSSCL